MFYCQTENVESAFWKEEGDIKLCSFFCFVSFSFFFLSLLPFHLLFLICNIFIYIVQIGHYIESLSHLSLIHLIPSLLPSHTVITVISFIIFPSTVSLRKIIGKYKYIF